MPARTEPSSGRRRRVAALAAAVIAGAALVAGGVLAVVTQSTSPAAPPAEGEPAPSRTPSSRGPSADAAAPATRTADSPPRATGPGRPLRLRSRQLGLDASVVPIDTGNATLVPPSDPQRLGWWRGGALPGAGTGRVLITGHTLHTGGGAFDDLEDLDAGNMVEVTTDKGVLRYRVTSTLQITFEEFAARAEHLLRPGGPERLVLVTCEDWNGSDFEDSVVVIATPTNR